MLPVVAIVGRANVGKSTLFNALTGTRAALVASEAGLTRDRRYGVVRSGQRPFVLVDTAGVGEAPAEALARMSAAQTLRAIEDADLLVLLVDARAGLNAADESLAVMLRRSGKPLLLVANKCEGQEPALLTAEFHRLGLGAALGISAAHREGLGTLRTHLHAALPDATEGIENESEDRVRVAVVGRPNVGKSTLVNRVVGEERMIAHDAPGTTRDSIDVPFERHGRHYVLVDTAGVRRRARVEATVEKFSVLKTLQAIAASTVVVVVIDAREGVSDQDLTLLGHVLEAGRALVVAVNKWDGLDAQRRAAIRDELSRRLAFLDFAPVHFISALHGSGVGDLFPAIDAAHASATRKLSTPALTRVLRAAVAAHAPPVHHRRRIKLRYAHQGGSSPPCIVIHGSQTEALDDTYRRYLERAFREALGLQGTPLRLELRTGENPFAGRRNRLSPRQRQKRKRLLRHVKR